ncbi:MAG TPA: hypothetical protein VKV29_09640 [Chthonomonas sp.]|uniref:hypothetical protein n=1 Tax=Chthonomonas sp. TaxID=2282153 RepID=UPI002B4B55B7|nr:hypothetical protein [Chthonomonas sp.]HLH80529.1 hypothetical protein [Chthonomonas sp.]
MSWARRQDIREREAREEGRRVRGKGSGVVCVDCGKPLRQTHEVACYGLRCRLCWLAFTDVCFCQE